ncbi:MAG: hypothetical protein NT099_09020 [Candidatus Saganbacteria bacterium]|nr:hypothetical protein [Candidatus Saganbacteria bacterium]
MKVTRVLFPNLPPMPVFMGGFFLSPEKGKVGSHRWQEEHQIPDETELCRMVGRSRIAVLWVVPQDLPDDMRARFDQAGVQYLRDLDRHCKVVAFCKELTQMDPTLPAGRGFTFGLNNDVVQDGRTVFDGVNYLRELPEEVQELYSGMMFVNLGLVKEDGDGSALFASMLYQGAKLKALALLPRKEEKRPFGGGTSFNYDIGALLFYAAAYEAEALLCYMQHHERSGGASVVPDSLRMTHCLAAQRRNTAYPFSNENLLRTTPNIDPAELLEDEHFLVKIITDQ